MEGKDFLVEKCRACGNVELKKIISLGNHYVSNFVAGENHSGVKVPLSLALCNEEDGGCGLLQMEHDAPAEEMWNEQYWYKSGINPTIKADLKDIIENVEDMVELEGGDTVIDIGCNDGTMMGYYSRDDIKKVGFDPSRNVAKEAIEKGIEVINNFFNKENFKERFGNEKAKVITAISMFYDLENPNQFLEDVNECLEDDGLFVVQQNYLVKMLENNGFDNICHEHREYYSLLSMENLLRRHNMEVFDVTLNEINGGSIRTYIRKVKSGIKAKGGAQDRINEIRKNELSLGLNTSKPYVDFANRIDEIKEKLVSFLKKKRKKGKIVCASGASTKGNTTLQYFEFGPEMINAIGDKNPDKFGMKTIGTNIPICLLCETLPLSFLF
jgi:NDP-4-keto-2,6-dideoxyhexose 3-C-methyltransferase